MASAGPGQVIGKYMVRTRKGRSPRNALCDAPYDDVRLVGVTDVSDAFANIAVAEAVDKIVGNHSRIVNYKPLVVVDQAMFCRGVVEQAPRARAAEVSCLRIGFVGKRAAPGDALLAVPSNVVVRFRDIPVLGVLDRGPKTKPGIVKSVTDGAIVGVREAIEVGQSCRICAEMQRIYGLYLGVIEGVVRSNASIRVCDRGRYGIGFAANASLRASGAIRRHPLVSSMRRVPS